MIAQQAAHLTVFQRTSHYTIPAQHHRLDPDWLAAFKQHYADYRRRIRVSRGGASRDYSERRALETPPQPLRYTYEARWALCWAANPRPFPWPPTGGPATLT